MESAGMMKMATGEGSPSGRVPERAPERFLVATEASGGGTPDLLFFPKVFGYMDLYRQKKSVRGAMRGPRGWRAHPGGGRAPLPRGLLGNSLTSAPRLLDHARSKYHAPEGFIPFGLRLIFLFCETLKQGKNRNWHWLSVNKLVPIII